MQMKDAKFGLRISYAPTKGKRETGEITQIDAKNNHIFVRFDGDYSSKCCKPSQLEVI